MVNSEIGSDHTAKGSKKKGKAKRTTLNFNEFVKLTSGPGPLPNLPLRKAKIDDEIFDDVGAKLESDRKAISNIILPTAPKSSCNIEINDPRLPSNPPYIIFVSNLPYDFEDEELNAFFENISGMNIPRDDSRKSKGCAYIELEAKENLVSALNLPEIVMRGRRLRIELVNDNSQKRRFDSHSSDHNHRISDAMCSDWRAESRSDSSNRDSYRKHFSRSNKSDFVDVAETVDTATNWRNASNGTFQTKRHTTDMTKTDFRTHKMENNNQNNNIVKERPKLLLCPRSKPLSVSSSSSSSEVSLEKKSSIFGNAKPVDTAARERQIEDQLLQTRQCQRQRTVDKEGDVKTNESNSNSNSNVDAKKVYKPPRMRQRESEVDLNMNGKPPINENESDNGELNYEMMNGEKTRLQLKKSNADDIQNLNTIGKINFIDTNKFACLGDDE